MRNVHRMHVTDIWSWYRVELRAGDHLGRSEELAEPESLASLGGSAPGVVDGILSSTWEKWVLDHPTNPSKAPGMAFMCLIVIIASLSTSDMQLS